MKDKVYYDENCYICSFEINTIRNKGEACGIEFIDINSDNFDYDEDYESEMIGEFNGEKTIGAETFRKMYDKIGFRRAVAFSRFPVIKHAFDFGYYIFAYWVRPHLPRRKSNEDRR